MHIWRHSIYQLGVRNSGTDGALLTWHHMALPFRMLSDYTHFVGRHRQMTQQDFHSRMSDSIDWFKACTRLHGADECAHGVTSPVRYFSTDSQTNFSSKEPKYQVSSLSILNKLAKNVHIPEEPA